MKFKNTLNTVKPFKKGGMWIDIQPGEIIDLGEEAHISELGLELISDSKLEEIIVNEEIELIDEVPELKNEKELKRMTRDELNDYAAGLGFKKEIKVSFRKSTMINKILKLQNEKFKNN